MQYALQMYNPIKRLDQLGHWMDPTLSIDLILARLPDSFAQFVLDYEKVHKVHTIPELINVLEMTEGKMAKKKGKETTRKGTSSKDICFHCGQDGHWKKNYKAYLELKNKVACDAPSSSGIYVIMVNTVGYVIPVVAHTYGLICRAQGTVESSQRESPTFGLVMVQEL